nr:endonuclease/exonuclease/phosphatase family protein [Planosporangium thailandense]
MRLLSYNVHGLRDDVAALAAVVRAVDPDVVVVQEAPRRFRWRTKSASLAHRLGLYVAGGGLPALGNLVLTNLRVRVHEQRCVRYPLTPGRHLRGAVVVDCSVGGTRFAVAGSHLATDDGERPAQAEILRRLIARVGEPLLLGIDVNEAPGGDAWRRLTAGSLVDAAVVAGRADAATFPVARPDRRIDAVFVDGRCAVLDYRVFDPPEARRASDHFPVLVDVALPPS